MASKIKSFMSTILSCSKSNKLFLRGQKKEKQNFPYSRVCVCVCVCACVRVCVCVQKNRGVQDNIQQCLEAVRSVRESEHVRGSVWVLSDSSVGG